MGHWVVVWDGTDKTCRQLTTEPETRRPLTRDGRVVGCYRVSEHHRGRVLRALRDGAKTRLELLELTKLSAYKLRHALDYLLLHERVRVADRVHVKGKGRCRFVYEVVWRSSLK